MKCHWCHKVLKGDYLVFNMFEPTRLCAQCGSFKTMNIKVDVYKKLPGHKTPQYMGPSNSRRLEVTFI